MNISINLLKIAIKNNKKGFIVKNNNINIKVIKALIKIGLIKFVKLDQNKITAYINYVNNKTIFNNIINMWKKNNIKTISYKKLTKINEKYNWLFIISTNKGILNTYEAIKKKTGGVLLMKIWN